MHFVIDSLILIKIIIKLKIHRKMPCISFTHFWCKRLSYVHWWSSKKRTKDLCSKAKIKQPTSCMCRKPCMRRNMLKFDTFTTRLTLKKFVFVYEMCVKLCVHVLWHNIWFYLRMNLICFVLSRFLHFFSQKLYFNIVFKRI